MNQTKVKKINLLKKNKKMTIIMIRINLYQVLLVNYNNLDKIKKRINKKVPNNHLIFTLMNNNYKIIN